MDRSATTHVHVQRMLAEIHQHYWQRVTLASLANKLQRQSAYVGRLFRDEVGITVHAYITRARMTFGATQIRSGVKIEAVALELGYRSKKNFYRQFRRRFGMTPEVYRSAQTGGASARRQCVNGISPRARQSPAFCRERRRHAPQVAVETRDGQRPTRASSFAQRVVRALLDQRIAIIATDDTGRCVVANEAAVGLTGYPARELMDLHIRSLFPEADDPHHEPTLHLVIAASSLLPANAVLRTKSAGSIGVHLTPAEHLLVRSTIDPVREPDPLPAFAS